MRARNTCLIGTPAVGTIPFRQDQPLLVPLGQRRMAGELLERFARRPVLDARLRAEYRGVVRALQSVGTSIYALNLDSGDPSLARHLRRAGVRSLGFVARQASRWQLFPRDMFLLVEHARTLLVHAGLFCLNRSAARGYEVVHSPWAEGGRVLLSGDRMIVGHYPDASPRRAGALGGLARRGVRVASIPLPIVAHLDRVSGRTRALCYDTHIDRSATLVAGRDGRRHLVLDPGYRTGPLDAPLSEERSAERVRRACGAIDVEVHQPRELSGPYGVATVQLASGHVLVGAAEGGMRGLLARLVGVRRVVPIQPSVMAYPLFAAAGLHCLVTDLPVPLMRQ